MTELYINVHFDSNGELDAKLSHAHRSEAIIYADEDANYLHTIHYSEGRAEVVDLTDEIRAYHAEVALERRHELSFAGSR